MRFQARGVFAAVAAAAATLLAGVSLAQDQPAAAEPGLAPSAPAAAVAPSARARIRPAVRAAIPTPALLPAAPAGPAVPGVRLAPGQPIPPAELEAFIDGTVAEAMARDHIAGAAVAVVQNGQIVLKKGYGVDRLDPVRRVDPDRTLFRLGSITKTFTWIALMREIEAGHIRLDAPINLYLPQKDQIPDQGYKRQVLVRDLPTHSAGFEDRVFGQAIERNPDRIRPLDIYLRQERPRRVREAGSLPTYSNYGAGLAGEALVQVTGKTLQALIEQEITRPLGMSRTTLREPYPAREDLPAPMSPQLAQDLSQGFGWSGRGFKPRSTEYITQVAPAGAASSTAGDMGRYMLAILGDGSFGGASIYSPAIARQFRTALQRAAPGVSGWDHGFAEYRLPGGFQGFGHGGATLSFHSGMVTVPALGLGVFVVSNTETGGGLAEGLPQRIVERFYAPPGPLAAAGSPWLRENASAFAGDYLSTRRAYGGLEGFIQMLSAGAPVSVTDEGVLLIPTPDGPTRWIPEAGASLEAPYVAFRQVDGPGRLVFQMQDGRARRWYAPSGAAAYDRGGPFSRPWQIGLLAVITGLCSIAALLGLFLRDRREFRQTSIQGRVDAAQISGSILWLVSLLCFVAWLAGSADAARLMYGWPGAWLLIASASAFVATVLAVLCLVLLPVVWRGGRRLDSWTAGRKARFTATTLIFCLFALTLGLWGALEPWSR